MSDPSSKPAIPAWQRTQQPLQPESRTSPASRVEHNDSSESVAPGAEEATASEPTSTADAQDSVATQSTSTDADRVKAFLQDPGVKDESLGKKRAFLESKGVAKDLIDRELGAAPSTVNAADFASFKASTPTQPRASPAPQAPPIITYPEFLAEARKLPPLITPSRIINTAYIASGVAALIYGASTFLVKPMTASLTEARHDFSTHSLSKINDLNARLSKIVSTVPEPKKTPSDDTDDAESITSDPTELFHRDMGTQTSPPLSPTPSVPTKSTIDKHNDRLAIISSHLTELLTGLEDGEDPAKERLDEVNKLRHDLDTMLYRMPAPSVWSTAADGSSYRSEDQGKQQDAIEEFKKEIRGVKGVLLSAKRFAPVGGVGGR